MITSLDISASYNTADGGPTLRIGEARYERSLCGEITVCGETRFGLFKMKGVRRDLPSLARGF